MDAIASDDKQCNTGKYQDADEGYRITFVAERNSQESATSADEAKLSTRKVVGNCAKDVEKSFSQLQLCRLRTFACE